MNKPSKFIITNLWWIIPLLVTMLFWDHVYPILILLIFAYIGRVILNPIINLINLWIKSRKLTVIITVVLSLIVLGFLSLFIFPLIGKQISAFQLVLNADSLTKFIERFTNIFESILPIFIFNFLSDIFKQFSIEFSLIWESGLLYIKSFIGGAGSIVFTLGSALLSFLIVIVFMIIFLLEEKKFTNAFLHAVPSKYYSNAKRMLEKISNQIHAYIRGQLIAATSVAVTSIVGLYILQLITNISIPYTIIIGIIAGLFNIIPFAGPIIGMIPAIVMYLITDQIIPIHFLYIILIICVFGIVQLIDNLVMSPYIMGGSVGLHPIIIIILVLLGASISGILGMLFAVPIAAIVKVIAIEMVTSIKK